MKNQLFALIINRLLKTNVGVADQITKLKGKTIELIIIGAKFQFEIIGSLVTENENIEPNVRINIPLSASTHLINHDQLKTMKQIQIEGELKTGQEFLQLLSQLHPEDLLYQHDNMLLGVITRKLEKLIIMLINYLKLVISNGLYSSSQYIQYESQDLVGYYEIKDFCNQVDELSSRYELLNKRIAKLRNI